MIYPKRLIEVDLPIRRISDHARREKSIRHGHISTLHIWWARRPLAACRAVIFAALWPDPADELCPEAFRQVAREWMGKWSKEYLGKVSPQSYPRFISIQKNPAKLDDNMELRGAFLDFIADFANWDNSTVKAYLDTSRALTQSAHEALGACLPAGRAAPGTRPLVVDPFAGGGSIPLEALRVGADAFASDLNSIPVLLNKVVLEYIPKYGHLPAGRTLWRTKFASGAIGSSKRLRRNWPSFIPACRQAGQRTLTRRHLENSMRMFSVALMVACIKGKRITFRVDSKITVMVLLNGPSTVSP